MTPQVQNREHRYQIRFHREEDAVREIAIVATTCIRWRHFQ
jgi:hypothetical protein